MQRFEATRVLGAFKRGNSWPVLTRTPGGVFVTKLAGAAQGSIALVAEAFVAELAWALDLPVPERALVWLPEEVPSDDKNDELEQLLRLSVGWNLGFRYLTPSRELTLEGAAQVEPELALRVLWLDAWVMNLDRTVSNPNLIVWQRQLWLIDHGVALPFHHDLDAVTEQEPSELGYPLAQHLFARWAPELPRVDAELAARFSLERLMELASRVPAELLQAAFPGADPTRLQALYAAYLWKRLKPPRRWVT